ncbi:MAG: methyl-accepting chemotaxis protein [Pseudomonadota bacterium]
MASLKYRISPSDDAADEVSSNVAEIVDLKRSADQIFAGWDDIIAQFKTLSVETVAYRDAFAEMRSLQAQREIEVGKLSEIGPKARKQLTSIMETAYRDGDPAAAYYAGIAQQELMLGRFYTERFLLTNSEQAFDKGQSHFAEARLRLDRLLGELQNPDRRQNAEATIADLAEYQQASEAVREIIRERNAIRADQLDTLGPKMQGEYEKILETIVARQNTLGPEGERVAKATQLTVAVVAAIALFIGALLAFFIGRSVTASVVATATEMNALAKGDLSIEIKGADKEHELGQMAKAVVVFKDALVARQAAMEKEKAEAEAIAKRQRTMDEMLTSFGSVVDRAVAGDFSGRLPADLPERELNELADGVNRLLETVQFGVGETGRVLEQMASGDLNERMQGDLQGDFAGLKRNVNETVERLADLVGEIASTTDEVRSGSQEINASAQDLAQRSEQQASSLQQTAATMEEMSASVKSNAEHAADAFSLAADATSRADKGSDIVEEAVSAMSEIQASASKIADIISVIDGIAFQTNLLALNAAVEAARAGDAGKGFAVVASEVRSLAQRSSEASSDIRNLIETSAGQVDLGVELVTKTGTSLEGIVASIGKVEAAVNSISKASQEQSNGIQEIVSAINHMDQMTQQSATMSDRSAISARSLTAGSDRLHELVAFFRVEGKSGPVETDGHAPAFGAPRPSSQVFGT